MRTTIFKFLFAITALAVVSCDEWNVEIDTQIMRDGSCVRTVKSDNNGCLTEDEGWTVVEAKDSVRKFSNDKIQAVVISRRFDRAEDMSSTIASSRANTDRWDGNTRTAPTGASTSTWLSS